MDEVSGFINKVALDKTTCKLKTGFNTDKIKTYFFNLNLNDLTLSFKQNETDEVYKKIFDYKQFIKFSFQLSQDEEKLLPRASNFKVKIIFVDKAILLLLKSLEDLIKWTNAFKTFFEKKTLLLKCIYLNDKKVTIHKEKSKSKLTQEFWYYLEKSLMSHSDSFVCTEIKNENSKYNMIASNILLAKITKKRNISADKISQRGKTSSMTDNLKFSQKIHCKPTFYKSKILKSIHSTKTTYNIEKQNKLFNLFEKYLNNNREKFVKNNLKKILNGLKDFNKILIDFLTYQNATDDQHIMEEELASFRENNIPENKKKMTNFFSELSDFIDDLEEDVLETKGLFHLKKHTENKISSTEALKNLKFSLNDGMQNIPSKSQKIIRMENEEEEVKTMTRNKSSILSKVNSNKLMYNDLDKHAMYLKGDEETVIEHKVGIYNEIQVKRNTKVMYREEEQNFLLQIGPETQHEIKLENFAFPKEHEHSANDISGLSNIVTPTYIDNNHFKPDLSLSLELSDDEKKPKKISLVESPHFGSIAVIAQRYNKIDNIDDWRMFINK